MSIPPTVSGMLELPTDLADAHPRKNAFSD